MRSAVLIFATLFVCATNTNVFAVPETLSPAIVKIGHVAQLTGLSAHQGKDNERGARLAIEELNASHIVIGGRPVLLVLATDDDAGDPRNAVIAAQRMVDSGVVAVVGHLASGTSIAASSIYSQAGVVQIAPVATNPSYTQQGFKTTYRLVATDARLVPALVSYAGSIAGARKVVIVDDSTSYGRGIADQFATNAGRGGLLVVSRDATNDKAVDFRALLTKIKSQQPNIIVFGGNDGTGSLFARQALALGIHAKILGGDALCSASVPDLAGSAADNIVCAQAGLPLSRMPRGLAFDERFVERYGQRVELGAPYAYDAIYLLVDAMKRAGDTSRASLLAQMPKERFDGVTGNISFTDSGDIRSPVVSLFKYESGKSVLVGVVEQ